jgi:putative RecB family exonuclease
LTQYSHSRLSSFENCPQQFAFRYIEKIQTDAESIESFVGRRVHEILERLYHHVERYGQPPSLSQVRERFRKDWALRWHPGVHIVKTELGIPHYQELGQRCLENYYRSHYPFDRGETVAIEQEISFSLAGDERFRMRGVIDRVVRLGPGRYEIHDYKTGGYIPPRSRLDKDRQLALYQVGIEQTYGDVEEVALVWHYLVRNQTLRSRRTRQQLDQLQQETISLIQKIESTTDFPARTGPLCRWCDYRDICSAVKQPGEPIAPAPSPDVRAEASPEDDADEAVDAIGQLSLL